MRRRVAASLFAAIVSLGLADFGHSETQGLVDEALRDPALVDARRGFIEALERKDEAALRLLLHPKVFVGNGGDRGPDDMIELVRDRPEFIEDYVAVLRLGGRFAAPDLFMAPFAAQPAYDAKDDTRLFAKQAGVVLRKEPRDDAPAVRDLGHAIVEAKFDDETLKKGWIEIVGPPGYASYIRAVDAVLVGAIFIHFRKEGERWLVERVF